MKDMPVGPVVALFGGVLLLGYATIIVHPFFFMLVPLYVFAVICYCAYKKYL